MSTFEVLASQDAAEQERLAGNRAVIAAQTRAVDAFGSFVAKADTQEEREARITLVSADLDNILNDVAAEYGYENTDALRSAATVALGGGHDSDCDCGFCANKGSFGKDDDDADTKSEKDEESSDDSDDDKKKDKKPWEKDASVKTACCGNCDGGTCKCDKDGCTCKKTSSRKPSIQVTARAIPEYDWEGMTKTADGFSFCECNCDGCNDANHCESEKCINTKHSGNPGNPASNGSSEKTAADTDTGDTFAQERESLPSSTDGLGDTGAVPTDKSKSGDNLGWDLKPIDVPSNQHPVEQQQIHETPDYSADLPGVSETGKSVSADTPLQAEFNTADNTKTWTGTEGQADPVTNESINVLSKWSVAT